MHKVYGATLILEVHTPHTDYCTSSLTVMVSPD